MGWMIPYRQALYLRPAELEGEEDEVDVLDSGNGTRNGGEAKTQTTSSSYLARPCVPGMHQGK
jgi:hypothetical protein